MKYTVTPYKPEIVLFDSLPVGAYFKFHHIQDPKRGTEFEIRDVTGSGLFKKLSSHHTLEVQTRRNMNAHGDALRVTYVEWITIF